MKASNYLFGLGFSLRIAAIAVASVLILGCGDDSGGDDSSSSSSSSSGSGGSSSGGGSGGITLEISGTPPSQIMQDTQFSYTPTVNNPDGVSLTFSASNLPSWATINTSTGRVTGTPGAGDVGMYSNIRVSVSGGGESDTSPPFSVEVVAVAMGSATLTWLAPTENTDGSPINGELAGFRIYWGLTPSDLSNSVTLNGAGISSYIIENLTAGTWYFAASAFNTENFESSLSNIATKTII